MEDLLAINFIINTLLLYLTARFAGRVTGYGRLAAGGFLAALYSLIIFLPAAPFYFSLAGKTAASLVIVAFTFRPHRVVELLRLCGIFFLNSFFLAGAVFALHFLGATTATIHRGVFYLAPPRPGTLFGGVLAVVLLAAGVWQHSEKRRAQQNIIHRLVISHQGKEATLPALTDTGNSLREPVTGRPLCVASWQGLSEHLPVQLFEAYKKGTDPLCALAEIENHGGRFGVAPYRSLENSGILVTFRPEAVYLEDRGKRHLIKDAVFALTVKALSPDGNVEVLLHPDIPQSIRR